MQIVSQVYVLKNLSAQKQNPFLVALKLVAIRPHYTIISVDSIFTNQKFLHPVLQRDFESKQDIHFNTENWFFSSKFQDCLLQAVLPWAHTG